MRLVCNYVWITAHPASIRRRQFPWGVLWRSIFTKAPVFGTSESKLKKRWTKHDFPGGFRRKISRCGDLSAAIQFNEMCVCWRVAKGSTRISLAYYIWDVVSRSTETLNFHFYSRFHTYIDSLTRWHSLIGRWAFRLRVMKDTKCSYGPQHPK